MTSECTCKRRSSACCTHLLMHCLQLEIQVKCRSVRTSHRPRSCALIGFGAMDFANPWICLGDVQGLMPHECKGSRATISSHATTRGAEHSRLMTAKQTTTNVASWYGQVSIKVVSIQLRPQLQDRHLRSNTLPGSLGGSILRPRTQDSASKWPGILRSRGALP